MARKVIDDKTKEEIKAYYMACNNMRETSRKFNVSPSTVKKIVDDDKDEIEQLRTHKKTEYIDKAWQTIYKYIEHVNEPDVITSTSARDSAILIGTLHDKMIKRDELSIKREEIEIKRKELEEKRKGPEAPNVDAYVKALKANANGVWDDE